MSQQSSNTPTREEELRKQLGMAKKLQSELNERVNSLDAELAAYAPREHIQYIAYEMHELLCPLLGIQCTWNQERWDSEGERDRFLFVARDIERESYPLRILRKLKDHLSYLKGQ